jgi:predicted amidophosphoribosyltransferase
MANGQPTVESLTDPFILTFTPPPLIGAGVCDICHGSPNPGWDRCYSCAQTASQVSRPVELVVPITLCEAMGQMHHVLRSYKDSPDESVRTRMRLRTAALLYRFLATHRSCIVNAAERNWDVITTVPSSTGRAGTHPLELVIQHVPSVEQEHATLLRRGPGQLGHNRASDDGYEVTEDVTGMSVLLVDDTFTSGARGQSAASALQLAGAHVVAMVPVGRYIRQDFSPTAQTFWESARATRFDFETCCLDPCLA